MPSDTHKMLSPEEAQELILEHIQPLGHERLDLLSARGRVLAEDIQARADTPPCDNSAMDGYAVRFADVRQASEQTPALVKMVDDIPAGTVGQRRVEPGEASRIMTGAPIPEGADTVIRVEYTRARNPRPGDMIPIVTPEKRGANIRRRGEDMATGDTVLPAGTVCDAGQVGILAALRRPLVTVFRQPRLAILSTGDELVEMDEAPGPGRITNCNSYSLAALAAAHGAQPVVLPIARDSEAHIRRAVESALAADFIVSSGGVSVGDYDFVKQVLDDLGAEKVLWRVAMKPGKPLFFCMLRGKPYFGVPGNTVSSMMSFLQFVRPAIRKAGGHPPADWRLPEARAILDTAVHNKGSRRRYLSAMLRFIDGQVRASIPPRQGSHMLTSLLDTNGFVVLEPEERREPGDGVRVQVCGHVL